MSQDNALPGLMADRLKRAVAAFVRELFPTLDYFRTYVYQVVTWDELTQTGDLTPAAGTIGMPPLGRCGIRSPGISWVLSPGQEVVVSFDNGDPTRPVISHLGTLASGLVPTLIGLAGATSLDVPPLGASVARVGDTAGPFLITSGSLKVKSR